MLSHRSGLPAYSRGLSSVLGGCQAPGKGVSGLEKTLDQALELQCPLNFTGPHYQPHRRQLGGDSKFSAMG